MIRRKINLSEFLAFWVICGVFLLQGSCKTEQTVEALPFVEYLTSESVSSSDLPFSDAVRVGQMLYLSGKIGSLPGSNGLAPGGITGETKQVMDSIRNLLERNGSSMNNVVKCTVMLADIEEWAEMNSVYVTYFPEHKPARSAFGTSGLAMGARVEIECLATIP